MSNNTVHSCTDHVSPKSRLVALLLCWFLGWAGAHRFYAGKVGTAIAMICTFGGFGIWVLIDMIMIILGAFRDKQGRVLFYWFERYSLGYCSECQGTTLNG